ncbi:DUF4440 domain-containing protein [Pseudomonas extremaustralis]|uniref:YybH family protein n=1 Tax=Pseudomonas extremaustralis TaxID=359110 RepID=UPI0021C7F433|nr:DUF4440 domain-containing protein [Pseudomonas extremaustralis]MDB1112044.1 DUF4440 domain-containing protein [Pseudomonas extremaustralis]MDG2968019.1 DUF4440 domain-containing protein [Pseudomonas extremaustralis]UUJ38806.1 DUF4440 domain-containing protein [Pseudomonas extremaustralis]
MKFHVLATGFTACFSLFAFSVPATAGSENRPPEAAIKAENARFAQAYGRGDYGAVARLYTKDGALLPPGGGKIIGTTAITEYFSKQHVGSRPDTVSFANYEFYGDDQAVTEVSDAEIRDADGKLKYSGKQILIFLKQDGVWKLHRDMWNDHAL